MVKYFKVMQVGFISSVEYRIDFIFSILSRFFPLIIQYFLWSAIYRAKNDEIVMNYSYNQMMLYIFMAAFLYQFTQTGFEGEVSNDIRTGGLNKYLVQPISFFWCTFNRHIGKKLAQFIVVSFGLSVILVLMKIFGNVHYTAQNIFIFLLSLFISVMLAYIIGFCLSMMTFWINESGGILFIYSIAISILSGSIMPLDIFGDEIVKFLSFTPFYYLTYFSINIINGKEDFNSALLGILIQIVWIIILYILSKLLWKLGLKKYVSAGG